MAGWRKVSLDKPLDKRALAVEASQTKNGQLSFINAPGQATDILAISFYIKTQTPDETRPQSLCNLILFFLLQILSPCKKFLNNLLFPDVPILFNHLYFTS